MSTFQHDVDPFFVEDLRNYLFGRPGQGGFDLTAINTWRARDHVLNPIYVVITSQGSSRLQYIETNVWIDSLRNFLWIDRRFSNCHCTCQCLCNGRWLWYLCLWACRKYVVLFVSLILQKNLKELTLDSLSLRLSKFNMRDWEWGEFSHIYILTLS